MSTALGDFNLPWCCWNAASLISARPNLQCNPQTDCFPSTILRTHHMSYLEALKKAEKLSKTLALSRTAE